MDEEHGAIPSSAQLTMSDDQWEQTRLRAEIIGSLAERDCVGVIAADEAAIKLRISRRQVCKLLERYHQGSGLVTDLASRRSRGKGGSRLPEPVEQVIRELVPTRYLTRRKRSIASLHREIARVRAVQGLPVPARNTVEKRIARMNPVEVGRRREGPDSVRALQSAGDDVPVIKGILDQVQNDHTVIDLIVVDGRERKPVGRPYLTVAIDVFSRCLVGMVVTLEPPSAVSVGLYLAHAVVDKRPWLERLGVNANWPMHWRAHYRIVRADGGLVCEQKVRAVLVSPRMVGYRVHRLPPRRAGAPPVDPLSYIARTPDGRPVVSQEPVCDVRARAAICEALQRRSLAGPRQGWGRHAWLLTGLLKCPRGTGLLGVAQSQSADASGHRKVRYVYRCQADRRVGAGTCPGGASITALVAKHYVVDWLFPHLSSDRLHEYYGRQSAANPGPAAGGR